MKVYELMAMLNQAHPGDDVVGGFRLTTNTHLEQLAFVSGLVQMTFGAGACLIGEDETEHGLAELSSFYAEERDVLDE